MAFMESNLDAIKEKKVQYSKYEKVKFHSSTSSPIKHFLILIPFSSSLLYGLSAYLVILQPSELGTVGPNECFPAPIVHQIDPVLHRRQRHFQQFFFTTGTVLHLAIFKWEKRAITYSLLKVDKNAHVGGIFQSYKLGKYKSA
jgi:hypothetical protein